MKFAIGVTLLVLLGVAFGALIGGAIASTAEKERFQAQYPLLGRVRIGTRDGRLCCYIDFAKELSDLEGQKACRMLIAPLKRPADIRDEVDNLSDEAAVDAALKDAEDAMHQYEKGDM